MTSFTIPMTLEQYGSAVQRLADEDHIYIHGMSGELSEKGCKIAYSYDGSSLLTITIEHHPFYASDSKIEEVVEKWFTGH